MTPGQSLELRRRAIGPVHPWSCVAATVQVGHPARFSARRKQGGRRGPRSRMQIALRAKRLNPYSVASTSSPSSSVLKFFLDCGRHMFPRCRKQRRLQAIAPSMMPSNMRCHVMIDDLDRLVSSYPNVYNDGGVMNRTISALGCHWTDHGSGWTGSRGCGADRAGRECWQLLDIGACDSGQRRRHSECRWTDRNIHTVGPAGRCERRVTDVAEPTARSPPRRRTAPTARMRSCATICSAPVPAASARWSRSARSIQLRRHGASRAVCRISEWRRGPLATPQLVVPGAAGRGLVNLTSLELLAVPAVSGPGGPSAAVQLRRQRGATRKLQEDRTAE